jgi:hypothetical protein
MQADQSKSEGYMKRLAILALSCAIGYLAPVSAASAASASGPSALALAAVVAAHGSLLSAFDKRAMSRLFDGRSLIIPRVKKITIAADSIICKMSDVDITARSCDLVFRTHKRTVTGRNANEVYGTLAIAGVAPEGAAGSIIASLKKLECTIDPMVIKQKAGGGADCTFETGQ